MKKKGGKFTDKQIAELNFVESMPEDQINVEEIPEMSDWSGARRGFFTSQSSSRSRFAWTLT